MPPARLAGNRPVIAAAPALIAIAGLVAGCQQDRASGGTELSAREVPADEGRRGDAVVVNDLCPIGKDPIHMDGHPAELTRTFQGQTVGFCCDGCVEYWDSLTDEIRSEEMAKLVARGHAPGFQPG